MTEQNPFAPEQIPVATEPVQPLVEENPFAAPEMPKTPKKPRKRRTGLLFSTAAVLGLIGGVAGGFVYQKQRTPTPLPSLSVALPTQHKVPGTPPTPSADDLANDDQAKLAGDIRKLLLDKPSGAKDWPENPWPDGWESQFDYAISRNPGYQAKTFRDLNEDGLRRIAARGWLTTDGYFVSVELIQFHDTDGARRYMPTRDNAFPNMLTGTWTVWDAKDSDGYYAGQAEVLHGTVIVQVAVSSQTKKVPSSMVIDLTQKQTVKL